MKTVALLLALSFAQPAFAGEPPAGPAAAPIYAITATGDIEIGPDGTVHRYELDKGQPAMIEQALARSIEQWRFEPVTLEGRPVIAATRMRMDIEALPTASGDYRLRVEGVHFGAPARNAHGLQPPRYPGVAQRAGIGAKVLLILKLDEHGKVERVHTEQVNLDHRTRGERSAERWREVFADASSKAARRWTFDINETVNGEPVGGSVRVPVSYTLTDRRHRADNTWRSYVPGPRQPVPWVDDSAMAAADPSLEDGEVQSLNSRFRLTTELVGTLL